jgi:hypothetical protein
MSMLEEMGRAMLRQQRLCHRAKHRRIIDIRMIVASDAHAALRCRTGAVRVVHAFRARPPTRLARTVERGVRRDLLD